MPVRAAVFAHFDKDTIVDEYVLYYLKELKKVAKTVVFVSDSDLPDDEMLKITTLGITCIAERHGEYDFGSYKRGYFSIQNREQYDEIIFCNDSCYGPLFPLNDVFSIMAHRPCDFWGLTLNNNGFDKNDLALPVYQPHVQSYFLVIRKPVIDSAEFNSFLEGIQILADKIDVIIHYEIGMTTFLADTFSYDTYVEDDKSYNNTTHIHWDTLVQSAQFPLIKVDLLRDNQPRQNIFNWKQVVQLTEYPVSLIEQHLNRVRTQESYRKLFKSARKYLGIFSYTTIKFLYKSILLNSKRYKK